MERIYLDTNIILRLLTGDDPAKQQASAALFEKIEKGELTVHAPVTVIADAVYVLSKVYKKSRQDIHAALTPLVSLKQFKVSNRRMLLRALTIFATHGIDFSDAILKAVMEHDRATALYSYDTDFDRFSDISRIEPQSNKQAA